MPDLKVLGIGKLVAGPKKDFRTAKTLPPRLPCARTLLTTRFISKYYSLSLYRKNCVRHSLRLPIGGHRCQTTISSGYLRPVRTGLCGGHPSPTLKRPSAALEYLPKRVRSFLCSG